MTQEQYNRAVDISERLKELESVKKEIQGISTHRLSYLHEISIGNYKQCNKYYMSKIGTILDRHDKMIREEIDAEIEKLKETGEKSNPFWAGRIKSLLTYFKNNRVEIIENDFEYTILMDEPDRNLDIKNIMQVYNILSFHKPQTQIIAVVHNPALIYKLSKLDCVHFVEMTKGYLKKVIDFVNN